METIAKEYRALQAQIKALETEADMLKQMMIKEMDSLQADELSVGEYTIRYTVYESTRLDSKKLKDEQPELYASYTKQTTACRFQVA